jgi:hypothetical protein
MRVVNLSSGEGSRYHNVLSRTSVVVSFDRFDSFSCRDVLASRSFDHDLHLYTCHVQMNVVVIEITTLIHLFRVSIRVQLERYTTC